MMIAFWTLCILLAMIAGFFGLASFKLRNEDGSEDKNLALIIAGMAVAFLVLALVLRFWVFK